VFLTEWFYPVAFEVLADGATAGKRAAGCRVVVGGPCPVVAGNGKGLPVESAHPDLVAVADQRVVLEAGALLAERRKQQGILVPVGDRRMQSGRDDDFAAEGGLQRSVAADVVGVGMGVDQARQPPSGQRVADQVDGLGGMGDVAAIDQRRLLALEKEDVVGRQPAAFEDEQGIGEPDAHSGVSGSALGRVGATDAVAASATMPGSPSGGRPQPRQ